MFISDKARTKDLEYLDIICIIQKTWSLELNIYFIVILIEVCLRI